MGNTPNFWKTSLEDIDETINSLKKGKIVGMARSAGERPIYAVFYGEENNLGRTANLSSALGAGERACYADKNSSLYRPTVFLVGCIHGGEFEGTAALMNLINLFEKGKDLKGERNSFLLNALKRVNFLIIPCVNPDGRNRVPFDTMVGHTLDELRYYNQGTWKDGSLCGYPECKKVHPIKDACEFLGAYFNDDGVNLMHDDFFRTKSSENDFLFDVVDKYCPDFTILLHGGTNTSPLIFKPTYSPTPVKERLRVFENNLKLRYEHEGMRYCITPMDGGENNEAPASFNLPSALYQLCGEPCITYESNQGLTDDVGRGMTHEEIYKGHIILFEEAIKFIEERRS